MRALASLVLLFPFLGAGALPAQQDAPIARIAGLVTAGTSEPLPLAEVWAEVHGEPGRKVRIELRGATPEQQKACVFRLRAVDDRDYVALPRPFEPASRVCVRLLDEDGLPVGGAFVRLQQDGHLLGLGGSSFEGSCVLAGLNVPAGELRLLVTTTRLRADFGPFTVTATNGLIDLGTVTLTSDATARK